MKNTLFALSMLMLVGTVGTTVYAASSTNGIEIKKDDDKKKKKKKKSSKKTETTQKSCCASKSQETTKTCTKKP